MQSAEYVVLQLALPGVGVENIGVLLSEPASGRIDFRLRRDLSEILSDEEDLEYVESLPQFLLDLGPTVLPWLEEHASNFIRITDREAVMVGRFESTLRRIYDQHIAPKVLPFRTHLPVYSARAAAGRFGENMEVEPEGWTEAPDGLRLTEDMFVAHVTGRSMEPRIPDGSLCVFRSNVAGTRQGKLVLVENYGEPGENRYTIKRYKSIKRGTGEESWGHERIILEPLNPEYEAWDLQEGSSIRVIGEFLQVLI